MDGQNNEEMIPTLSLVNAKNSRPNRVRAISKQVGLTPDTTLMSPAANKPPAKSPGLVVVSDFDPAQFSILAAGYKDDLYVQLIDGLVRNAAPGSPLHPGSFSRHTSPGLDATFGKDGYQYASEASPRSGSGNLFFRRFVEAMEDEVNKASQNELVDEGPESVSSQEAAANVKKFLRDKGKDLEKVFSRFSPDGLLVDGGVFPASAYNDFYKWTMLPVMRVVENAHPQGIVCTFSANIRDPTYRRRLYDSAVGRTDSELINSLQTELDKFASRPFDRTTFERVSTEFGVPGWDEDALDKVCGQFWNPNNLADRVVVDLNARVPLVPNGNEVVIHVFMGRDNKIREDRVFIEATGPWHRVTWLETSLMQCIYDVLFRDSMRKKYASSDDSIWYPKWLAGAFVRCARSELAARRSGLKGALFGGRRTGGMPLLMIQCVYLKHMFVDKNGADKLIGTSSVTAHYWLRDAGIACPPPAGTHAHELSMVLAGVLCDLDDEVSLPLSQAIGHALYFHTSVPQGDVRDHLRRSLMPMLPDTLGTRTFMKIVDCLKITRGPHKGEPLLSIIGAARQDSGDLVGFRDILKEYAFQGDMMASEIESPSDLFHAKACGYSLFGAGGFFGDSRKAWDPAAKNISMAIKVLRVYVGGVKSNFSPVKTGDPTNSGEGKFEADGLLSTKEMEALVQRTTLLQATDIDSAKDKNRLQHIFEATLEKYLGPEQP